MSQPGSAQERLEYEQRSHRQVQLRITDLKQEIAALEDLEEHEINLGAQQYFTLSTSRAALSQLLEIEQLTIRNIRRLHLRIKMYGYI